MELFVYRKGKMRKLSEPQGFYSSVFGADGFLDVVRTDLNDSHTIYKKYHYSILSMNKQSAIIHSPPDKKIPHHHASVLHLESQDENNSSPEIIISA